MNDELQKYWDDALAEMEGGRRTPLARHRSAILCGRHNGHYTVTPVRILPNYCSAQPHRNRFTILVGRTTHLAYHLGQAILAERRA